MLTCVILLSGPVASESEGHSDTPGSCQTPDKLAGPTACLEILGQSVLDRTIRTLQQAGVKAITVVAEDQWSPLFTPATERTKINLAAPPTSLWSAAICTIRQYVQQGADTVLVRRLGPYAEFDLTDLLRFSQNQNQLLTPIAGSQGTLAGWVIRADQVRKAGMTGCEGMTEARGITDLVPYALQGYVNGLKDARDYRRLVVDAFLSRCAIQPTGREVKPGVWIDENARIHRRARIVAPTYVGRGTKVREEAVITRFSNLEGGCEVDRGTLVDAASVLTNTYLGKSLEVSRAVVDGNKILHLQHNTVVEISDANLLGRTAPSGQFQPLPRATRNNNLAERLLAAAWSQIAS